MNLIRIEPPHWHIPDATDYGQQDAPGYWRAYGHCSDGTVVIGHGDTADAARASARAKVSDRESYLGLSSHEKLRLIRNKERILDNDQQEAIRLLIDVVLGK